MLKTMHLKAHAFEDNLSACGDGNLFEEVRYLGRIESRGW